MGLEIWGLGKGRKPKLGMDVEREGKRREYEPPDKFSIVSISL